MDSLQKIAVCLLFLSVSSSAIDSPFATFICSDVKAEYNETAVISCICNKKITNMVVKRCENCNKQNSCLETIINTWAGNYSSEKGRIQLVIQNNVSELHIQEVKATDQGGYKWYLYSDNGQPNGCTNLEITAPEIEPNFTGYGRKLTCLSPIGHPQRQIHWFDGHRNNLTGRASLVSEEAEGGLTSLTSTLHETPTLTASEYCCTVLYDVHTKRNKTKCLSAHKAVADYLRFTPTPDQEIPKTMKDPETPKTMAEHVPIILVLIVLVLCCFAAVLYYRHRQRAMAKGNFADLLRTLLPVLKQHEKAEENAPNQEV
ncbi:alpha-1B-glycoprotein-like [Platysternon megacephalum]|uniref:Alpha-1B-glycoprotein-like n=1 Tax=Platysternon megacephalum TaxID=55544 RepID=A0A4D9DLJ6_9SAUR|nr:alpha-1B-glycoprotein-like [Platysternon megacephalum]